MRKLLCSQLVRCFQQRSHNQYLLQTRAASTAGILSSPFEQLDLPVMNLVEFGLREADRLSEQTALVCGVTNRTLTYNNIKQLTRKVGSAVLDAGLGPGKRLATLLPNLPEFAPILYGTTGTGATLVPLSPLLTPPELLRTLLLARPEIIVTVSALLPGLTLALVDLDRQPMVILLDGKPGESQSFAGFINNDGSKFDQREEFDYKQTVAVMPFSSGTTGPPKGVMLSHYNLTSLIALFNNRDSGCSTPTYTPDEGVEQFVLLSVLPLFHMYGLACNILQPLSLGLQVVMMPSFTPESYVSALATYQPHFLNLVPPLVAFLAANPHVQRDVHLSRCKILASGGAPLSPTVLSAMQKKMHPSPVEFKEGYGLTESTVVTRTKNIYNGSVGQLINNTQAKVLSVESGEMVGPGVPGELCVRGPQVMMGYFENEEQTNETIRDGWLYTGDIVTYDTAGNFYIVDRIKDLIKVKGYQVSPTEVEDCIRPLAGVADVCVIGVPHDTMGEAPKAFVVKGSDNLTEDEIHAWLKDKVSPYKRLAGGIVFVTELPKSPTGKVLRKVLRQQTAA